MAELRDPLSIKPVKFSSSFDPVAAMNLYGARKIKAAEAKMAEEETKRSTSVSTIMDAAAITTKLNEDKVNIIQPMVDTFTDKYTKLLATQNYQLTPIQQLQAKTEIASMKALAAVSNQQAEGIYKMYAFANEHQDKVDFDATMDNINFNLDPETWLANPDNFSKTDYAAKKTLWEDSGKSVLQARELSKYGIVHLPEKGDEGVFDLDVYVGTTLAKQVYTPSIQATIESGDITTSSSIKKTVDTQIEKILGDWYDSGVTGKGFDAAPEISNRWEIAKQNNNSEAIAAVTARDWFIEKYKPTLRTLSTSFSKTTDEKGGNKASDIIYTEDETPVNVYTPSGSTLTLIAKNNRNFSSNDETITAKQGYQYKPKTGVPQELFGETIFKPQSVFLVKYSGNEYSVVGALDQKNKNVWLPFTGDIKTQVMALYSDYDNWPTEESLTLAQLNEILKGNPTIITKPKIKWGVTK